MKILNGKIISDKITNELKDKVRLMEHKPKLAIVQVGDEIASNKYIKFKLLKAKNIGIKGIHKKFDINISQKDLINEIYELSKNVDGLIIQLPLPNKMNKQEVLDAIPREKDVDGLTTKNSIITPATPRGIMTLLLEYNISVKGKEVAVVGQSNLVGKPTANLCVEAGASIVNRFDKETGIKGTETADILIVAAGEHNLIKKENIKNGVVIIDVGINTLSNDKITGDVDRESVGEIPSAMSPVFGGVGPMTVISLFQNLIDIFK